MEAFGSNSSRVHRALIDCEMKSNENPFRRVHTRVWPHDPFSSRRDQRDKTDEGHNLFHDQIDLRLVFRHFFDTFFCF